MIGEKGPEHDKIFEVCASAGDLFNVKAEGHTKRPHSRKRHIMHLFCLKSRVLILTRREKIDVFKKYRSPGL